jgi:hypothetical protein
MHSALIASAFMVTIAAAVRSTWSPCGLSMLATITPMGQRGRGHSYRATVGWFMAGSTVGGVILGAGMLALSWGTHALSLTAGVVVAIVVGASLVAAVSDVGLGGVRLPVHHRQVNERWLDLFRPWVYGAGFGWQIGTGLATYIMTAAVYLMMVDAAFAVGPGVALALGVLFGLVRGCAVFLGRGITSADSLQGFHRSFQRHRQLVRRATIGVELGTAVLVAGLWSIRAAVVVGDLVVVGGAIVARRVPEAAAHADSRLRPARPPAAATRQAHP